MVKVREDDGLRDRQGRGFKRDPKAIKIGTKWVVTNCGTEARLVEKEFADTTKKGELFAGTPWLPALRCSVSKLATNKRGEERKCVGVMNAKSASIIIEVPTENPRSQLDEVLAKLVGSLQGTRDAPMIWQD